MKRILNRIMYFYYCVQERRHRYAKLGFIELYTYMYYKEKKEEYEV